jgi:two-component system cell cycle response regulator
MDINPFKIETWSMNEVYKQPAQEILVVDDEQSICDFLTEALVHLGHRVQTANDGVEAIEKVQVSDFDIVITDMIMPRMDGMELIRYLVENQKSASIIAITGHTMSYQYTDVIAAGASDFIAKPFTINELEAKLNRVLRERQLLDELQRLAVKDPLTGLYNRRMFQKIARNEAFRSVRYQHPLCLFFLDIDNFKEYNDIHGHKAGDDLLIEFARVLTVSIRKNIDSMFRFGGDEFTLLLPHLSGNAAIGVGRRIREIYNRLGYKPTFLSIGIAEYLAKTGDADQDIEDMVQRSDRALYYVKHNLGGNEAHLDEESALNHS